MIQILHKQHNLTLFDMSFWGIILHIGATLARMLEFLSDGLTCLFQTVSGIVYLESIENIIVNYDDNFDR